MSADAGAGGPGAETPQAAGDFLADCQTPPERPKDSQHAGAENMRGVVDQGTGTRVCALERERDLVCLISNCLTPLEGDTSS